MLNAHQSCIPSLQKAVYNYEKQTVFRKKIIGSVELGDGDVYVPSEEAVYIGISVFNCVQSKGISFETYEEMFANGFVVGFKPFAEES